MGTLNEAVDSFNATSDLDPINGYRCSLLRITFMVNTGNLTDNLKRKKLLVALRLQKGHQR